MNLHHECITLIERSLYAHISQLEYHRGHHIRKNLLLEICTQAVIGSIYHNTSSRFKHSV